MKTVSEDFLTAQRRRDPVGVRRLYYKRRYWDEPNNEYTWESSWTELPQGSFSNLAPVVWNLDSDRLNEFKVSNVSIMVDNSVNQWRPDNPEGFFGKDDFSALHGYEPYWMKFQIRAGFLLEDDTEEVLTLFTGLATEYTMHSTQKTCQITVQGLEAVLINSLAEGIATNVTAENAGTGNGSEDEFETDNPGVGGVSEVSLDGIKQVEGEDYSVSQLDDPDLPAKITFVDPPDNGEVVRASYFYWPQDIQFHELVEELLLSAGITDYDIEPVIFENSVLNAVEYTSAADWAAWTLSNMEITTVPGAIKVDWSDSEFLGADTGWTTSLTGWTLDAVSADKWETDGTYLIGEIGDGTAYRSVEFYRGQWEAKFQKQTADTSPLKIGFNGSMNGPTVHGSQLTGIEIVNSGTPSMSQCVVTGTAEHTIRVQSSGKYLFFNRRGKLFLDGSLHASGDYQFASAPSQVVGVRTNHAGGVVSTSRVRNIKMPPSTPVTCTATSPTIDMGATPTAWGTFEGEYAETTGLDDIIFETRTSSDGMSWSSWEATVGGVVQSALNRYAQIRVRIEVDCRVNGGDPEILSIVLRWVTSGSAIVLPALSGKNVYESLQSIGKMTNYEFGFTPDEEFFFRRKTAGDPVFTLSGDDYGCVVNGMDSGYERVYGTVRATYGDIIKEVTDDGLNHTSPKARVLNRRFDIDLDDSIQMLPSTDIASGIAITMFKQVAKPKRRFKLSTVFMPQLDLSDVVTVYVDNNHPNKLWYLGDPNVYIGQQDINLWGYGEQIVNGMQARIIGARFDISTWTSEFDLEEVLT